MTLKKIDKSIYPSIGLSFVLLGVQLGTFFRYLSGFDAVYFLMFIGGVLLFDYKNLLKGRYPSLHRDMFILLVSQIIILIYCLFAPSPEGTKNIFVYYSIVLVFAFSSQPYNIVWSKFIKIFFILSSITALIGGYIYLTSLQSLLYGNGSDILDEVGRGDASPIFLFPRAANLNLIACLLYISVSKNKTAHLICSLLILFDFIIVLSSGKRTVFILFILYIIYFLWANKLLRTIIFSSKGWLYILVLLFIMFGLFNTVPFLSEYYDRFADRFVDGVKILLGMEYGEYDESAATRPLLRQWAFSIVDSKFSIINYIFGYGYMTRYIDQPFFQALFDMGIVGCFVYIYQALLFPLKHLLKRPSSNPNLLFAKMINLDIIISCFHAGVPYGYTMYLPVLCLIYFSKQKSL